MEIIVAKGTGETANVDSLVIPDLWHASGALPPPRTDIIKVWHLAHSMRDALLNIERHGRPIV